MFQVAIPFLMNNKHWTIINTKFKVLPQKDEKEGYTDSKMVLGGEAQHF